MSPLQQRMLEDMQLRGLSARTQEAYARAVWQLAQYYHRSPEQLSEEELRQYFLYLTNEKKIARPTATIALCGIKFLYEQTLKQPWPTLRFVRPPRVWKLPVVLSREEVRRILREVRIPLYRACLKTISACGLRLLEGTRLQLPDVDSARMLLHIHGKNKQDRFVTLPALSPQSRSPPATGHLVTRRSVTPLSQTAFCGDRNCFVRQAEGPALIHRWPTRLKPALVK